MGLFYFHVATLSMKGCMLVPYDFLDVVKIAFFPLSAIDLWEGFVGVFADRVHKRFD